MVPSIHGRAWITGYVQHVVYADCPFPIGLTVGDTAPSPESPHAFTATESPRCTLPVFIAAPIPAITPQPSRADDCGSAAGSTLVHWPSCTTVLSSNAPIPKAGVNGVPSGRVMGCEALWVSKQYHGAAAFAGATLAADSSPVENHKIADLHVGEGIPDGFGDSGGLVAEEEGSSLIPPSR